MSGARKSDPTNGQVLGPNEAFQLARRHQRSGKIASARDIYQKILEATPEHAESLHFLGLIAHREGDNKKALQLLQRAAMLRPGNADFHTAIGLLYQRLNRIYDAENALRRASQLAPDIAKNHLDLGVVLQIQERWTEAESAYGMALQIHPAYADAHNNLGTVLHKQGELASAQQAYRRALELTPDDPELNYNLGCLLQQSNALEEAADVLINCLKLDGVHARAYQQLGRVRQLQQLRQEAESLYEKAIALKADYVDAYVGLATVHDFSKNDQVMRRLQQQVRKAPAGDDRDALLSVQAKAHEHLGQYSSAFSCYRRIMQRTARLRPYDGAEHRRFVARVKEVFRHPPSQAATQASHPVPVFLIGMSRSGKTLLESLLAQHPAVHAGGELQAWSEAMQHVTAARELTDRFPALMEAADEELIADFGRHYLHALSELAPEASLVVNTLPGNHLYVGLILQSLPDARIIFCRRDSALDHCLFIYFKRYTRNNSHSYDLESLGAYYLDYHELLAHWQRLYGDRILTITYEEMVRSPQPVVAAICQHCGLSLNEGLPGPVNFHSDEIGYAAHFEAELEPLRRVLAQGKR